MQFGEFGNPKGRMTIRNYVLSIYEQLGAVLEQRVHKATGQKVNVYVVNIPPDNLKVPVFTVNPTQLLREFSVPLITLNFDITIVPELTGFSLGTPEYRVRVSDNPPRYKVAYPGLYARVDALFIILSESKNELLKILHYFFRRFPIPYGVLEAKDTENYKRYINYQLTDVGDATEIAQFFERVVGYNVTLSFFAPVDLTDYSIIETGTIDQTEVVVNVKP